MSTGRAGLPADPNKAAVWTPAANPWLIAATVMTSTFMVVLDSSVANVALPHIAGNLSASTDESTWVLTSYLVSNAIMLPATGWLSRRIGRKYLLMSAIVIFTLASFMCGAAVNMPMLILARVLQGLGGGGMQPLAQSILLESFPKEKRGMAMAAYGVGVVVAPVIGPTLGGWITDSYSWRWIFYINLPIGVLAFLMTRAFIEDPPYLRNAVTGAIDYIGFSLMALWLGTMQLVLDKGQEEDWFSTDWIIVATVISAVAFLAFIWREVQTRDPIVNLRVLLNRNFAVGTLLTTIYGMLLYGVTAMLPLFLQTLMGYPALDSGLAVSPRGVGAMISMIIVGRLVGLFDNRVLIGIGFGILGYSTLMLGAVNLDISMGSVGLPNLFNGFASGCIFVPLTTLTMGTLRNEEIGNASGVYNLMRNIGGSIGIAGVTTLLARGQQMHQNFLVQNVTPYDAPVRSLIQNLSGSLSGGLATGTERAWGLIYGQVQRQATLLAFVDNFRLLGYMALFCIPIAFLFRRVKMSKNKIDISE